MEQAVAVSIQGLYIRHFGDAAYMMQDGAMGITVFGGRVENARHGLWYKGQLSGPINFGNENSVHRMSFVDVREYVVLVESHPMPYLEGLMIDNPPGEGVIKVEKNIPERPTVPVPNDLPTGPGVITGMRMELAMTGGKHAITLIRAKGIRIINSLLSEGPGGAAVLLKDGCVGNVIMNNIFASAGGGVDILFEGMGNKENIIAFNAMNAAKEWTSHVTWRLHESDTASRPDMARQQLSQNTVIEPSLGSKAGFSTRIKNPNVNGDVHQYQSEKWDEYIEVDAKNGDVVVNLPYATKFPTRDVTVKKIDESDNAVRIKAASRQTIDGVPDSDPYVLSRQYQAVTIFPGTSGDTWDIEPRRYVWHNKWLVKSEHQKSVSAEGDVDFTETPAGRCEDRNIAARGAEDGDLVSVAVPSSLASIPFTGLTAFVSATDIVTVRRCNHHSTEPAIDPPVTRIRVRVMK
jgi:hypothetical protein